MREVLQNCVDRVPILGHKPKLENLTPLEVDGFLTATYPRIDPRFLSWRREGFPQFAVFTTDMPLFRVHQMNARGLFHASWYSAVEVLAANERKFRRVPDGMAEHYVAFGRTIKADCYYTVRYSGLMTNQIREQVHQFQTAELDAQLWIVAEVEPSAWRLGRVQYEDPLVVISRGHNDFWLLGWYDLTAGEDRVLGTMTE